MAKAPDGGTWGLGRLIRALAELPGLLRLRYTTSHPRDMDDELIDGAPRRAGADAVPAFAGAVRLRPHPGGDEPQAHARTTTAGSSTGCARLAPTSRCRRTSSSAIPARPTADFAATLALVSAVGFAQAFSFKYSPRPGTPAAGAPARSRRPRRIAGCRRCRLCCGSSRRGSTPAASARSCRCCSPGRAGTLARSLDVHNIFNLFTSPVASLIGEERPVRIRDAHPNSLSGTLVQERLSA